MGKTDDYAKKAAEFLKQWQSQMSQQLNTPDMIAAMLSAMNSFGAKANDKHAQQHGDAPDAGNDAVRQLTRRVDALEQQLAKLNAQLLSMAAKTQNTAGTGNGRRAKPVAKRKPAVAAAKRGTVQKPKSAAKRKK